MSIVRFIDFMFWKILELVVFIVTFPFLFIGAWGLDFSEWCGQRAAEVRDDAD